MADRHNEFGVALEHLCDALHEEGAAVSLELYEDIRSAGEQMSLDRRYWEILL